MLTYLYESITIKNLTQSDVYIEPITFVFIFK